MYFLIYIETRFGSILHRKNERGTRKTTTMNYTYSGGKETKSQKDSRSRLMTSLSEKMLLMPNVLTRVWSAGPVR